MRLMTEERASLFEFGELGEILGSISEGDPGFRRRRIYGVSTDSRTVSEGQLFIAIKGDKFNGHDYLDSAFAKGAIAAIVEKREAAERGLSGNRYIQVDNTLDALGYLAAAYRRKMPARIVGVTGSNGKTTVKNLIYGIISTQGPALKSQGNFNNLIGLPISIFNLRQEHKFAVVELGMSARGEIDKLGSIANPDVAVITNVGPVHLEFLRIIGEVANAKLEILAHIKSSGTLVINGDDKILASKLPDIGQRIIKFGLEPGNDIRSTDLEFDNEQMPRFKIRDHALTPQIPGIHNVYNVLAAYSTAIALGIDETATVGAINSFQSEGVRSEIIHKDGLTLLVDCYNANPASTKSALETLAGMQSRGHRIAVLGDMLELGENAAAYHGQIGEIAAQLGIDYIFAFGPLSIHITNKFGNNGFHFDTKEGLVKKLLSTIKQGDMILFKGSRGMALEEVVNAVKK